MKKRHFGFLFMALSVFVSCSDNIQKSYWDDGTLKSELRYKDGKLDGECVWYYSNGQKVLQAFYKDDLKEGHALRWYVDGVLQEDCWYKQDKLDSVYRSYSKKGKLASEEFYVDGKLNGASRKWYDNGQVFQEGQFVDGMMDGSWFIFYPSGALAGKAEYKMGTGKQICYEESGYKCLEVPYVNNLKHGKEIYYNPDGRVTKIVEYERGEVVFENNDPQNMGE